MDKWCFKDTRRKFAPLERLNIAASYPVYTVNLLFKSFQPDKAKVNSRLDPVQIITNSKLMSFLLYLSHRKTKQTCWDHMFPFHLKGWIPPFSTTSSLRKFKKSSWKKCSVVQQEEDWRANLLSLFVPPSRWLNLTYQLNFSISKLTLDITKY